MNSSNQPEKDNDNAIDAEEITRDYLKQHPEFFIHHEDILNSIRVPHRTGAISLIERQIDMLKKQNKRLKSKLDELVDIAHENDRLSNRLHKLTLRLMRCAKIEVLEKELASLLQHEFDTDAIALKLFGSPAADLPASLYLPQASDAEKELSRIVNKRIPQCGTFDQLSLEPLFENQAEQIKSIAVLPLYVEKNNCFGVLVIGSHNENRFRPDMGVLYLERMTDILSHILLHFIPSRQLGNAG